MSMHRRGGDPPASRSLARVLRAAAAPAHPQELAGERAALAAFRAHVPRRRSLLARVLTVKVLVLGTVAASTGVVLATAGGVPWPEGGPTPPAHRPAVTDSASEPAMPQPAGRPTGTGTPAPARTTVAPSTTPTCGGSCVVPPPTADHDRRRGERPHRRDPAPDEPVRKPRVAATEEAERDHHTRTPDSPADGDVPAAPPNGVAPPLPGG